MLDQTLDFELKWLHSVFYSIQKNNISLRVKLSMMLKFDVLENVYRPSVF